MSRKGFLLAFMVLGLIFAVLATSRTGRGGQLYWQELFSHVVMSGEEFKLSIGHYAFVKPGSSVKVTFIGVLEDSRCAHVESPIKMLPCDDLTAGRVRVVLGVEDRQHLITEMHFEENYETGKSVSQLRWNDYLIKLLRVDPYPVVDQERKTPYKVTLSVTKE